MKKGDIKTKIFIDGGDPEETRRAKEMLGWLDGQTTNPSLIAKNLKAKESDAFNESVALEEYKRIVREMNTIVPDGSISIQVFANHETSAEEMLEQARERVDWIPNASIKFPCTHEGLKAASIACRDMPINITLVFSQAQAAGVYEATKNAKHPVFISPFVGRLDDLGEVGMDVVGNILRMYQSDAFHDMESVAFKSHVEVLTASIRNLDHLLYALHLGSDIATIPFKVFQEWAGTGFKLPKKDYQYPTGDRAPIPYDGSIQLGQPWQEYDLSHPLTDKGLSAFWNDWMGLFT